MPQLAYALPTQNRARSHLLVTSVWPHARMFNRLPALLRTINTSMDSNAKPASAVPHAAASSTREDHPEKSRHYRTIWISDIHLGTAGCQAAYLLDFLKHNDSDTLYLVGDILDGWQLRKNWYWPQSHNDVVQKILRKARKGTRVVYVPGNHDAMARQFIGLSFGDITVADEIIHTTADGKRLLVTHGDLFDGVMQHARWLAYVGDSLYTFTLVLNRWFNWLRAHFGYPYWSLSQYLKHKVKNAVSFISAFERVMTEEAKHRQCDGVVCGHIHKAEIRSLDGFLYCNDGDWVESLSALAETADGHLEIIYWTHLLDAPVQKRHGLVKAA